MKQLGESYIYKWELGECSNQGISSKYEHVHIVEIEKGDTLTMFRPNDVVIIEDEITGGVKRIRAVPVEFIFNKVWDMYGGSMIRVGHNGISLHDRKE